MNYDSLVEYHLKNPETKLYSIVEDLTQLLDQLKQSPILSPADRKAANKQIQELLTDGASKKILELFSRKNNIDKQKYDELIDHVRELKSIIHYHHYLLLIFLSEANASIKVAARILGVDLKDAEEAITYFKQIFVIDDFLTWLKNFLSNNYRHKQYLLDEIAKNNLRQGGEEIIQPVDTADARKNKLKRQTGLPNLPQHEK